MARFIIPGYDIGYYTEQYTFDDQTGEIIETEDWYIISDGLFFEELPHYDFNKINVTIGVESNESGNLIETLSPTLHFFKFLEDSGSSEPKLMAGFEQPVWISCSHLTSFNEYVEIPDQASFCIIVLQRPPYEDYEEGVYFLPECKIMRDSLSQFSEGRCKVPPRPGLVGWSDYQIMVEPSVYRLVSVHGYEERGSAS